MRQRITTSGILVSETRFVYVLVSATLRGDGMTRATARVDIPHTSPPTVECTGLFLKELLAPHLAQGISDLAEDVLLYSGSRLIDNEETISLVGTGSTYCVVSLTDRENKYAETQGADAYSASASIHRPQAGAGSGPDMIDYESKGSSPRKPITPGTPSNARSFNNVPSGSPNETVSPQTRQASPHFNNAPASPNSASGNASPGARGNSPANSPLKSSSTQPKPDNPVSTDSARANHEILSPMSNMTASPPKVTFALKKRAGLPT
ncbi:hypothetical protein DIPPA_58018 [Diplonema papillatum]|nr:hypothetical protein DIPPA_58018 [Diplonema papillatum]